MSSSSQQDEVDILGGQLAKLDDEIGTLMTKRAKIRCRLNQFRARTSVLPPEALSIIFQYACDLPETANLDDDHRPVAITSVSVHWREVAQSTPSIWNRLCLNLKNAKYASEAAFNLLQLYFKNLGGQPINLRLSLPENSGNRVLGDEDKHDGAATAESSDIPISSIFQFIIKDHPNKLRALFINLFSLEWSNLFIQNINPSVGLPNLNKIHIGWQQDIIHNHNWKEPLPLQASLVPRLTDVSLTMASPSFQLPHAQITDLHLEDVAIDYCLHIINLCTSATECHIFYPQPPDDSEAEPPENAITLNSTSCLGWAFGLQKWDVAFLKHYTFPSLQRFRCEDQGPDGLEDDDSTTEEEMRTLQRKFLSRCPKLTVYERAADSFINWELNDLCDDLPDTVEELYLRRVEAVELDGCVNRLTRGADCTMEVFPHLKILELQGNFRYQFPDHAFSGLIGMVESRRRPLDEKYKDRFLLEELSLKWGTEIKPPPPPLTEDQEARLQELVNGGLKVTTTRDVQDEYRVWLPVKPVKA